MLWLDSADSLATDLPAAWLIATDATPRNLAERSALRRSAALRLLARQLGRPETGLAIDHDLAGRPYLVGPSASGLHISLATRGGIVAVALARGLVGIDVERVDMQAEPPFDVLHPDERAILDAADSTLRPRIFARLWAAKEAYVKALGTGFRRAPESFAVTLLSDTAFGVIDESQTGDAVGSFRAMKNGGHEIMAAALVMPGRAGPISPAGRRASS